MIYLGHGSQIQILNKLCDMSGQYSLSLKSTNISQTRTIVPRLYYSNKLLGKIIYFLETKEANLRKSNKSLSLESDKDPKPNHLIDQERTISFSSETLFQIQKKINGISKINEIPKVFPALVPIIRTISAQLEDIYPEPSRQLSELSVHLGSIVLDAAILTKAHFDFSRSNLESSIFLDEVKLIVDSKISKQYPHLDFF